MQKEKFASQADSEVLAALRALAESEGRQFQSLLDEALRDFIEKKRNDKPRAHVMAAFEKISRKRNWLYTQLAK
jgi:predicted transcriptional regulator